MHQHIPSPYTTGSKLIFHRHLPPPPLGSPYSSRRTKAVNQFLQSFPKLDVCLMLPPTEGPQPTGYQKDEVHFEIIKEISIKMGHGAQVVLGIASFPTQTLTLVAKIYDPLFYPGPGPSRTMVSAQSVDFTEHADKHYTREAAAYTELDPLLGGKELLKYYGSWTCNVLARQELARQEEYRPVRLILLEYIPRPSVLEVGPKLFTEEQQFEILGQLIETSIKITYYGVEHRDLEPRNVLVDTREDGTLRVVVFDFGLSVVHRLARRPVLKDFIPIPNPPFNHKISNYSDWEKLGWVKLSKEWMERRWGSADFNAPPKAYKDLLLKRNMIIRNTYVDKLPNPSNFSLDLKRIPPPPIMIGVKGLHIPSMGSTPTSPVTPANEL